jgi:putative MFS transporter
MAVDFFLPFEINDVKDPAQGRIPMMGTRMEATMEARRTAAAVQVQASGASLTARLERLPMTRWHTRVRVVMGAASFFDAFNALAVASALPVLVGLWHLSGKEVGALIAIGYVGQLLGALFFGWFAERVGRIPAALWSVLVFSIMSIAGACAWNFMAFLVFRFIQGFGLGGEVPVAATYVNEISKASTRGRFFMLYESVFLLGILLASIFGAWVVPEFGWRYFLAVGALPAFISLYLRRNVPESPRWLISKHRFDEADRVISSLERQAVSEGAVLESLDGVRQVHVAESAGRIKELFSPAYLGRTLVLWTLWFCAFLVSYGTTTWFPTVVKTVFHMSLQTALLFGVGLNFATLLISIVGSLYMDSLGRRRWFIGCFAICFLAMGSILLFGQSNLLFVLVVVLIGVGAMSTCAGSLYLYSPEIYPTRLRGRGVSIASCWGRVASIAGPYLIGFTLQDVGIEGVFIGFCGFALLGAVVSATSVIETRLRTLEEISY